MMIMGTLTGCNDDITDYKQTVERNNKRVERLLSNYENDKKIAKELEDNLRNSIVQGSLDDDLKSKLNPNVDIDSKNSIFEITNRVLTRYISDYNDVVENQSERSNLTAKNEKDLVAEADVYYFLDSKTGTLEQLLILETNSRIDKISIYWAGGQIDEIYSSVRN